MSFVSLLIGRAVDVNRAKMAYALSEGALPTIMSGGQVDAPIMQILGTRKMSGNGSTARYRLLVSDGLYVNSFAMLATQLNDKVSNGELDEYTIIRIARYITSMVPNSGKGEKRVMILLDISVLAPGAEVGQRIGNPQPLTADGQQSAPVANAPPAPKPAAPAAATTRSPAPARTPTSNWRGGANTSVMELSTSTPTQPISSLTPYSNKWVIKARITSKSAIRTWSNAKGEGKLFSFEILDESGEMRVTAFKEQCDKFYDLIEVGKVYMISRGSVKPANKQYCSLNNDYELTLNNDSQIIPVLEDTSEIPTASFNFSPLSEVENLAANAHVDIIGVCRSVDDVVTFTARTSKKDVKKREVHLVDKSMASISLTLWGQQAEEFNGDGQPVIAVKGGVVNEFGGAKSVSAFSTSTLFVNPDIPEAHQLRGWYDNEGSTLDYKNVSERTQGPGGDTSGGAIIPLDEIKTRHTAQGGGGGGASYHICKATIVLIKSDAAMYNSCPGENCNKKVVDLNNGLYRCEKCNQEYPDYNARLLLSMSLADWSSNQWVTCFHETAEQILGRTAMELRDLKAEDPQAFQRVFNNVNFTSFTFKLRAQEQTYNDESRLKLNVMFAKPMDHAAYSRKLLEELKELYN